MSPLYSSTAAPLPQGLGESSAMFSSLPEEKSSRILTAAPSEMSARAICEPIKPAPPVTKNLCTREEYLFKSPKSSPSKNANPLKQVSAGSRHREELNPQRSFPAAHSPAAEATRPNKKSNNPCRGVKKAACPPADRFGPIPLDLSSLRASAQSSLKVRSPFKNTLLNTRPMAQDKQRERGEQRMKISLESCIS